MPALPPPPDRPPLAGAGAPASTSDDVLIERLLRVIDEGRRTATYKLALLSALIDAAAIMPGATEIPTRFLAERVLALYYPQTRVYVANDGVSRELRQISMKSSPVLREVLRLRVAGDAARCRSVDDAKRRVGDVYGMVLDEVESTFVRYPIPLLQVVGAVAVPFLYAVDWPEGTSVATLRRAGRDRVRFLPGVADRLVVLGPMLRPLIQLHWTRDVARWTGVALEDDALHVHLFGSARIAFPPALVAGLYDLQHGSCFYCRDPLAGRGQVDHFLAWSRWPNDAVENLVLADRCNLAKRDHLVTSEHLSAWRLHTTVRSGDLRSLAAATGWTSEPVRTLALVRSTYGHLAAGTPLWRRAREFEIALGPLAV